MPFPKWHRCTASRTPTGPNGDDARAADECARVDADLAAGAGALALDAGRAVLIDGADGAEGAVGEGAEPPPPPLWLPGRKANMRNKVMAKPVCSSGASDKSGRLVIVI